MKYLILSILFITLIVSCSDDTTNNVTKVEKELVGSWNGKLKLANDSIDYTVKFEDSEFGKIISADLLAVIEVSYVSVYYTTTIQRSGTAVYTFNKPNIVVKFDDPIKNAFNGELSADGKSITGKVRPYDFTKDSLYSEYTITLYKK